MSTVETQLQLSIIYRGLLTNLMEVVGAADISPAEGAQCIELINDAFSDAVNKLSARCPVCDMDDLTCGVCGYKSKGEPNAG